MATKTKRRFYFCSLSKNRVSRSEFEKMSALYDELYEKADKILKIYDPCRIIEGRCLDGYPCCDDCAYLSKKQGCLVKSLACKLWLCEKARRKFPVCASELKMLEKTARRNPLLPLGIRSIKEVIFSFYEIAD